MIKGPGMDNNQDYNLDIQDFSGRNFDNDVLDTIVETAHTEPPDVEMAADMTVGSDDILDEDHWASDSFDELKVDQEY